MSFLTPDRKAIRGEGGDRRGHDEPGVIEQAAEAEEQDGVGEVDRVAAPGEWTGRDQGGRRPVGQDVGPPPPHLQHRPEVEANRAADQQSAGG